MNEVTDIMSSLQNYPGALIITLVLWLVFSVSFCAVVGYIGYRLKQRRRPVEGTATGFDAQGTPSEPRQGTWAALK